MEPKKIRNTRVGPERIIQNKIMAKLRLLNWSVRETHGNLYQFGFPDLYCAHRQYGARWVEVKDPERRGNVFTEAQMEYFYELTSKGIGIWVLTSDHTDEISKIHKAPNWHTYLQCMR